MHLPQINSPHSYTITIHHLPTEIYCAQNEAMRYILLLILTATIFQSCYRNDITFGELPPGNYTDVVSIDTVEARLSTLVTDSFITSGATSFLVGKYKD